MLATDKLLDVLGYSNSPYYKSVEQVHEPEIAHFIRLASETNVKGVYLIQTSSPESTSRLPQKPVVYVAEANSLEEAKKIHKNLWNLNFAPFIIIKLPHQIRVYTGFAYSANNKKKEEGLLAESTSLNLDALIEILSAFSADAIDSGTLWQSSYGQELDLDKRVDKRLLKNLKKLGTVLKKEIPAELAQALIGKYVYINYLRDRGILTDSWLETQSIQAKKIFSLSANIDSFHRLTDALEAKFNGKIFPIDFTKAIESGLQDKHISWVASIFSGSEIVGDAPKAIHQLHLPFQAYDFRYIPVETFSAIYEQFIQDRKEKGAVYTPEFLADYALSVLERESPLHMKGKLLDPACGSGIFLVLAYRRLIEKTMQQQGKKLTPYELKQVLQNCIYGVEREQDACYVTEFSLILTLLHYVEPPDLEGIDFKFPSLHNTQIFETDFFDIESEESEAHFWQQELKFDWVVGNPPWISSRKKASRLMLRWQKETRKPVGSRVHEAFSLLATDLLSTNGRICLLISANTLFNPSSKKYRQELLNKHDILHITNFANVRDVLFGKGKGSVLPAMLLLYQKKTQHRSNTITHIAPFKFDQMTATKQFPWTLTIFENDISYIPQNTVESGDSLIWKLALWGSWLDNNVIKRLENIYIKTLEEVCDEKGFHIHEGSQIRDINKAERSKLTHKPELLGKKRFNTDKINTAILMYSLEEDVILKKIPESECYILTQGGEKGLLTTLAPHIIISPSWGRYFIYSDLEFVISKRQIGIAKSKDIDTDLSKIYLKALTIFLSSNLVAHSLFFHVAEWGVFRQANRVQTTKVKQIHIPDFTQKQFLSLANFHDELVQEEQELILKYLEQNVYQLNLPLNKNKSNSPTKYLKAKVKRVWQEFQNHSDNNEAIKEQIQKRVKETLQNKIDKFVFDILQIPEDMQIIIQEFVNIRLKADVPSELPKIIGQPALDELLAYGQQLQNELNEFMEEEASHQVQISFSSDLIECIVTHSPDTSTPQMTLNDVQEGSLTKLALLKSLQQGLQEQVSQWVYVQRGLRLFEENRIYLYKSPRRIDWTRTQAILDAHDIISEIINTPVVPHETATTIS